MILEGKNRIRDLINDDIDKGQLGEDGTAETEADTGLGTPDATTLLTVTSTTADKQIQVDYNLNSTLGNGTTYAEYEITTTVAGTSLNRITFYDLEKTQSEEWQISTIIDIE